MCLVLKFDNGKVVSIANEQNQRIIEPSSTVLVYRFNFKINATNLYQTRTLCSVRRMMSHYALKLYTIK